MKTLELKITSLLVGILLLNFSLPVADADETLHKVLNKLNTIDEICYDFNLSVNYFSEDYQRNFSTYNYLNFNESDSLLGFQFQEGNSDYMSVYDGSKYFYIDKNKGTIKLINNPNKKTFRSSTFLVNSIPALRHFLPTLIHTKKIHKVSADTTIDGKNFRTLIFTLENEILHRFGELQKLDIEKNIIYTVIIDDLNMPFQVIQRDNINPKDFMSVTYKNISINSKKPNPESWKYELYLTDYKPVSN